MLVAASLGVCSQPDEQTETSARHTPGNRVLAQLTLDKCTDAEQERAHALRVRGPSPDFANCILSSRPGVRSRTPRIAKRGRRDNLSANTMRVRSHTGCREVTGGSTSGMQPSWLISLNRTHQPPTIPPGSGQDRSFINQSTKQDFLCLLAHRKNHVNLRLPPISKEFHTKGYWTIRAVHTRVLKNLNLWSVLR